jgi:hypothetical protein
VHAPLCVYYGRVRVRVSRTVNRPGKSDPLGLFLSLSLSLSLFLSLLAPLFIARLGLRRPAAIQRRFWRAGQVRGQEDHFEDFG